jgi:NADH-quinone oxidoreductase subunit L
MNAPVWYAVLLVAAPLAAALVGFLLPRHASVLAAGLGIAGATAAFVMSVLLAIGVGTAGAHESTTWVRFGDLPVTLGVDVGGSEALVAIAVAVVALAVQVYSVRYLADDRRYAPYAAQVSLFTAAMLLVLVSGDLILLLVGWEVMGICSYLLIGHDRTLPEAPAAAVKAFVVTRFGDVGFLLGVALLGVAAGTFKLTSVLAAVPTLSPARLNVICLLLLLGAIGKSAQFPLQTWLPDAMAGPTPISALIHAATMVAAGVIVLVRLAPLFRASPSVLAVIAVIAAITMLLGALAATAADDIKRVLAWSTVSQVAFMFAGFGVGMNGTALFHLLTHAAFKALLFLAAGCVIHAVHSNSMTAMGGLRKAMPVTFTSMTIGLAALAGVPPFSGFFSKGAIVDAAWEAARAQHERLHRWVGVVVLASILVTLVVTAWYATRLWLRVFFGAYRGEAQPHEAPPLMRWPIVILAVPSALLGFAGLWPAFGRALGEDGAFGLALEPTVLSVLLVGLGALSAVHVWRVAPADDPDRILGTAAPIFASGFRLDDVQDALVVRPVRALARLTRVADASVVDGAVEGVGRRTVVFGDNTDTWHRGPLPRAATAVFGGALLVAVVAVVLGGL